MGAKGYTVYKHTGPSGKVYIGITCQRPETRWDNGKGYKHSPHFSAAIARYGWENFRHEILADGLTREAAEAMEVALIAEYDSTNRAKGYNADKGGSTGPKHTEGTRQRIGQANRERVWSESSKEKLRAYRLAHPITPETAQKIGDANRGRKHRPDSVEKIRAAVPSKPVRDLDTGETFPSVQAAARAYGTDASRISAVCRGRRKTTKGHRWAFEEVIA